MNTIRKEQYLNLSVWGNCNPYQKPVLNTAFTAIGMLLLLSCFTSNAQPILTKQNCAPVIGEHFSYTTADYLPAGAGGNNMVWDFRALQTTGSDAFTYALPASGANFGDFPTANVLRSTSSGQETYYILSASDIQVLGFANNAGQEYQFSNPEESFRFPITYSDAYVDTFRAAYISSAASGNRGGADSFYADGWGKLLLPGGQTYNNVLRIHVMSHYDDTLTGQPIVSYTDERTFFYTPDIHTYLLSIVNVVAIANGSQVGGKQAAIYYNGAPNSVSEQQRSADLVQLSPQPATGQLHVKLGYAVHHTARLSIVNAVGQIIYEQSLKQGEQYADLNCTGMNAGCYFLSISDGQHAITRKVIIQ